MIKKISQINAADILLIFALLFSIFISFSNLSYLGLSYDESLFINASILKDETTFISKHRFGIPIMVMDYIGALKSWIYNPIFKIFGVNIFSIRVPMIMLMYLNLYLIYKVSVKYFDKIVVYSLLILLFTDLTFNGLHRIDHGPSAIETSLKLFSLLLITQKASVKNSFLIAFVLLLGVFNKLNFIWFVNAAFCMYLLNYTISIFFSESGKIEYKKIIDGKFLLNIILYLSILGFFIFILKFQNIKPNLPRNLNGVLDQISFQLFNILSTVANLRYENYLGWQSDIQFLINIFLFLLSIVLITNIYWVFNKKTKINSPAFNLFLFTIILTLQLLLTKEASNMWHVFMLYPFIQLVIINTIYKLSLDFSKKKLNFFYGIMGCWVILNIALNCNFIYKVKTQCAYWLYEPTINKLIDYTQSRPEKTIISLGFGIHSQLLVLDQKNKKYYEFIAQIGQTNFDNTLRTNENILKDFESVLIIENVNPNIVHKRENYVAMNNSILKSKYSLQPIQTIYNNCDKPLYIIYKIVANKSIR